MKSIENLSIQKIKLALKKEKYETKHLSQIANVVMGQSPDGKSYNTDGKGCVFFQGRTDFGDRYPTIRQFTTQPSRLAKPMDILLSVRAPVGDLNISINECCIGRGLASINSELNHYLYYYLKLSKARFDIYNGEGTVFGSINKNDLNAFIVKLPYNIKDLNKELKLYNEKCFKLYNKNVNLIKLRQLYLKKFFG